MKTVEFGSENNEVIILLHGGGLSSWNYRDTAKILSRRFRVILPVLDGHAGSDAPFVSIKYNAEKIIAYIDAHFKGKVLLMGGVSLGAQILVEILSKRNDICSFAIIESALTVPMKLTKTLIKPVYSMAYPLIKKEWFAKIQFKALHINAELFNEYFESTANIKKTDMVAFLTANSDYCIKSTLKDCKAKTLITVGGKEHSFMKKSAQKLAESLNASKVEVMPKLFHGEFSINHPQKYAERVLEFISAH